MKKTLYIHAGFHKTGTTSIQSWCEQNRLALRSNSIDYIELGCVGGNHAAYALCLQPTLVEQCRKSGFFMGLKDKSRYNYRKHSATILYSALKEYIESSDNSKFIISSECFMEGINFIELNKQLSNVSFDIKIIIYLRPQKQWIESVYKYVVMDKDLRYSGDITQLPQTEMLDFYSQIINFERLFGKENIILKNYNKSKLNPFGLIGDFFSTFSHLDFNESTKYSPTNFRENESFTNFEIMILNKIWKIERKTGLRCSSLEKLIYKRAMDKIAYNTLKYDMFFLNDSKYSNNKLFDYFVNFDSEGF
ncbi:hypothetical protein AB4274_14895 [Vibrio sp. 10N.261.55.A10]|uniref:hypothetical protein n=1 Tax=Vibrio sp. 10N.261.55.A10 TaxID=3229687 RepID=UPI00354CD429